MPLSANTKLGPYEVISQIGAGGMGEVYRARDTRLERTVAIKVLPSEFSSNAKQRFEREAKTISSLSHPHICTLHDVGDENGIDYLVMEYLEGQTLTDRLSKGPLPIEEVLRYAVQICDALDKAHRQGIVHRDLKPGNIMLTKHGVKLLDFGLAKWTTPESPIEVAATAELTLKQSLTEAGTILGTVQYMAPEQLEGKEADSRTDIFAFGAVLYEMASGKKAFTGKSRASLMAAILEREPERLSQLAPLIPPALDRVVAGCLSKVPEERWQTAHDLKLQLKWIIEGGSETGVPKPVATRRKRRQLVLGSLVGLLTLGFIWLGIAHWMAVSAKPHVSRLEILPPAGLTVHSFALSPNGRKLAIATREPENKRRLWIRSMDSFTAEPIPSSNDARYPFWSPDGDAVAFFADGMLKKLDLNTRVVISLCKAENGRGGTWSSKGTIVFAPAPRTQLHQVQDTGGESVPLTEAKDHQVLGHRWPCFLPNGEHFIYWAQVGLPEEEGAIFLSSLKTPNQARFLTKASENGVYAVGHLLYVNDGTLMAVRLDPGSLQLIGASFPIAENVEVLGALRTGLFSAAENGTLALLPGGGSKSELVWYSLDGTRLGTVGRPADYRSVAISPDGNSIAVTIADKSGKTDIWIYDTQRGDSPMRLTRHPGNNRAIIWSPDGKSIVFSSDRITKGTSDLYIKEVGSIEPERLLFRSPDFKIPTSWSPDGKSVYFVNLTPKRPKAYIYKFPVGAESFEPEPFLNAEYNEGFGSFSPDGKWIAHDSDDQCFAISYPERAGRVKISSLGGITPRWSPDGTKIYYRDPDNYLVEVDITIEGSRLIPGAPKRLFQIQPVGLEPPDVAPDGKRFLVNSTLDGTNSAPLKIVLNWPLEFQRK